MAKKLARVIMYSFGVFGFCVYLLPFLVLIWLVDVLMNNEDD